MMRNDPVGPMMETVRLAPGPGTDDADGEPSPLPPPAAGDERSEPARGVVGRAGHENADRHGDGRHDDHRE
jgi:hypothetical protein